MNNKEFTFSGTTLNGFLMLFGNIILTLASIAGIVYGIIMENELGGVLIGFGGFAACVSAYGAGICREMDRK